MTTDPAALALFAAPAAGRGPVESAMLESLEAWAAAAVIVDRVSSAALIAQARAVDMGLAAGRATNVSGANRVLLELLTGLGLTGQKVPAAGDALDRLVSQILESDADAPTPPP